MTLWLVGMMGSGKSTAGRKVAEALGLPFHDTDEEIESALGLSPAEIWEELGEPAFRDLESRVIRDLAGRDAVVSTGGGVVIDLDNRHLMKSSGTVVWLRCSPEELTRRMGGVTGRPLLDGPDDPAAALTAILAERHDDYALVADHEIDTSDLTEDQTAERIEALWRS